MLEAAQRELERARSSERAAPASILDATCVVLLLTPPRNLGALTLQTAQCPHAVAQLLREGANPNGACDGAEPPLAAAARRGDATRVRLLLAAGASADGEGGDVILRHDAVQRRLAACTSDYPPPLVTACGLVSCSLGPYARSSTMACHL